jgi:hypothetical protein
MGNVSRPLSRFRSFVSRKNGCRSDLSPLRGTSAAHGLQDAVPCVTPAVERRLQRLGSPGLGADPTRMSDCARECWRRTSGTAKSLATLRSSRSLVRGSLLLLPAWRWRLTPRNATQPLALTFEFLSHCRRLRGKPRVRSPPEALTDNG